MIRRIIFTSSIILVLCGGNALKSKPSSAAETPEYSKTGLLRSARRFPMDSSEGICVPQKIPAAMAAAGKTKVEKLSAAVDIDGIVRIDESTVENPSCYVYLPARYVPTSAFPKPGILSPYHASFAASVLIRSGDSEAIKLAKDILDNFIYEIENFGYVISSTRGYALTRSENNIIPTNILEYFEATKDYKWLENKGLPAALKIVEYWTTRIGAINLNKDDTIEGFRWIAHGKGPRWEMWGTNESPNPYYYKILYELIQLAMMPDPLRPEYAKGFDYNRVVHVSNDVEIAQWEKAGALKPIELKDDKPEIATLKGKTYVLSKEAGESGKEEPVIKLEDVLYSLTYKYFANDRAALVSGLETKHLYGPYGAFVDEFVDVRHNAVLYRSKNDIAKMYRALAAIYEKTDNKKAKTYSEKVDLYESEARDLKKMIFKYLWNENEGAFFNYSYHTHSQRKISPSPMGGYCLWAEIFDVEEPEEIKMLMSAVDYLSKNFEDEKTDPVMSGIISAGLRKYSEALSKKGMNEEAAKLKKAAKRG